MTAIYCIKHAQCTLTKTGTIVPVWIVHTSAVTSNTRFPSVVIIKAKILIIPFNTTISSIIARICKYLYSNELHRMFTVLQY